MAAVIIDILRMIKFSHSVFALPFALLAAFLAQFHATESICPPGKLLLIVICMVSARSVAMTFNRIADVAIDAANPRTANREIPTARIRPTQAWLFLIACAVIFVAACALFFKPVAGLFGVSDVYGPAGDSEL